MEINNLSKFEEQILNNLKETENKITKQITSNNLQIYENISDLEVKVNNLLQKNESIIETITNQKIFLDKLKDIEAFKIKADDIILSQDLKLKNNTSEITYLKNRYETIIKENLLVPGYIGNSCQYKNLSEYLAYNITELNKNKTDRENVKKEFKEIKTKYEYLIKTMIGLNDSTAERCKGYTNLIKKDIVNLMETKFFEFKENSFNIKADIYKYYSEHDQQLKNTIFEIKQQLNDMLKEKINEVKNDNNLLNNSIERCNKNIQDNYLNIKKINNDIEEINAKLKDIFTNIKPLNSLSLNNSQQSPRLQGMIINQANNTKRDMHRFLTKNSRNKEIFTDSSKKFIENNKNENYNKNNLKMQNLKPLLKTKSLHNKNEIPNSNNSLQKDIEYDCNSETDNNLNIINNNNNRSISFEKSKILKGKNEDSHKLTLKNKNLSTDLNKYFKKEIIEAKSINSLKDKNKIKSQGILHKYKERNYNLQSQKLMYNPQQSNYNKSQVSKDNDNSSMEKENSKKKIKLNYDLINKINQSKILDLYSFSISPPEGKINLNLNHMTINGKLQNKFLQERKTLEVDKDNDINYKNNDLNSDSNDKINTINNSCNNKTRKKLLKIKDRETIGVSTERIKTKSMNHFTPVNNIIIMPPKFNLPFNKTFIENDFYNENKINIDNFFLKNIGKELKSKDNNYCLTGK